MGDSESVQRKRKMPKESQILKSVIARLETYKMTGDVFWWRRLSNGLFYTRNGTPISMGSRRNIDDGKDLDLIVIVNCRDGTISVLFIDTKRTGVKKFSYEQQIFSDSIEVKPKMMCAIVNDPKNLWSVIKKARDL